MVLFDKFSSSFFFFFLKSINNDNKKKKKKKKATFNDQTYCLNWLNNYGS